MKNKILFSNKYKLIVLCGKSGAGKDYLLQKVKERYGDKLNYVIPDTTRPPREGEKEKGIYNFLTPLEFFNTEHLDETSFLTGDGIWYYGTPLTGLTKDKVNIGVFNIKSIHQLYEYESLDIYIFYVSADDRTRLLRQMNREPYPNYTEICRRFLADERDFKNLFKFPLVKLRNSSIDDCQCVSTLFEEIDKLLSDSDRMN